MVVDTTKTQKYPYMADVTKGMIFESYKMGVPHYYDWVMTTTLPKRVHLNYFNPDTALGRLLNMFTKCPWWVVVVTWLPHMIWMTLAGSGYSDEELSHIPIVNLHAYIHRVLMIDPYWGVAGEGLATKRWPVEILFGYVFFTWFEWWIHKFMFHRKPTSTVGNALHFILHGSHHIAPMDNMRLVMPPLLAMFLRVIIAVLCWATCKNAISYHAAMAGVMGGYLCYDLMHYANHHSNFGFLASIKRHHLRHHFHGPNEDPCNFALSYFAMVWDKILGTGCPPRDTGKVA